MPNILARLLNKKLIGSYMLIFVSILVFGQSAKETIINGDDAFSAGDYYSAAQYYKSAIRGNSTNSELNYKYAESLRLYNDYQQAEKYYNKIVQSKDSSAYPIALFWLASMNKYNGKYDLAKDNFSKYYKKHKKDRDYYSYKAQNEIESCKYAQKLIKDTVSVIIKHLDSLINSNFSDFGAVQLRDTLLVYSSLKPAKVTENNASPILPIPYVTKIYQARMKRKKIFLPEEIYAKVNDASTHNANIAFREDYKKFYFTRCNHINSSKLHCEIYACENKDGKWMEPYRLGDDINNSSYTSTHPTVATTGWKEETLYFSSDRPGGQGGMDLWYSVSRHGEFYKPTNLGTSINTKGDEITPFYDYEDTLLYFSSDWHKGLGGYDIFKTKGGLNEWSAPENIGFPVNTSYNDIYYTVNYDDTSGYLTSNRPGSFFIKGETCCNDIYSYKYLKNIPKPNRPKVDTNIVEVPPEAVLQLTISLYFHNDEPDTATRNTYTQKSYEDCYESYQKLKKRYIEEYTMGLTGVEKTKAEQDIKELYKNYIDKGYNNLNAFLDQLLVKLFAGETVAIRIQGFCSPLFANDYNHYLAQRRIWSLKNYINKYKGGIFVKYIKNKAKNSAYLIIDEEPLGKTKASAKVSDNANDQRNSVYSPGAALERKVEVLFIDPKEVKINKNK